MPFPLHQSVRQSLPPRTVRPVRTARSILATGATVLLAVSVTTGCGAGFNAQTNQPYQAAEGANGEAGPIAARNFLVIADDEGRGVLHGVLVNSGDTDDRLASIRVDESVQGVKIAGASAQPLPAGGALTLGGTQLPNATGTPETANPSATPNPDTPGGAVIKPVRVTGAKPGRVIKMTISFGSAGPITVQVPVITTDHYSPTPKPTPTSAEG